MRKKNSDLTFLRRFRRFCITNETAYKLITAIRVKKIKNLLEKAHIFIAVDKKERQSYEIKLSEKQHTSLEDLIWYVTDHCNLNCRSCMSFCPLAREYSIPVKDFERDILPTPFIRSNCFLSNQTTSPNTHLSHLFEVSNPLK
jgi:Fe-S oxidoreductase